MSNMSHSEPGDGETYSPSLQVFLENRPRFLGFLRRKVDSDATAEDILQQALLKAIRHEKDWDEKENILAWFYRILRNALTDHYRSRASEAAKQEAISLETIEFGSMPAEDRENLCACFEGLLPSLKPEYADVLQRIDLQGEAPAQVAASLGLTANNLGVRLHRARQSLRSSLEKTCGVCTRHGCLDCTCGGDKV